LKGLTRREMLFDVFTKDTLKNVFSAYHKFTKAQEEANKIASCEDAGRVLGERNKKCSGTFFNNLRKEG